MPSLQQVVELGVKGWDAIPLRAEEVHYLTQTFTGYEAPPRCQNTGCDHLWRFHSNYGSGCAICHCSCYYQYKEDTNV